MVCFHAVIKDWISLNPIHPHPSQLTEASASNAPVARGGLYPGSGISAYQMENNTITPATLPNPPSSNDHININIIIITIIFCMVCMLLLVAFFYAFCFHCTLGPSSKDRRKDTSVSVDREDATFRRTSSSVSLGNTVWNELHDPLTHQYFFSLGHGSAFKLFSRGYYAS